jgi:hypothetical protein
VFGFSGRAALAAALTLFVLVGAAAGDTRQPAYKSAPWATDGGVASPAFSGSTGRSTFAPRGQHGNTSLHLPAVRENIDVVSKLKLSTPEAYRYRLPADPITQPPIHDPSQPELVPGQIADVAVYKNAAYLASWAERTCQRGGFFSVDISNPAQPRQLAFVPALQNTNHGEGMQAITLRTPAFTGDVLAVNNEPCTIGGQAGTGGFDLYDVSDPANPQILVQGFGDQSPAANTGEAFAPTAPDPAEGKPNSAHSIFIWQDGPRAFAVIVDNTERSDVDIFDITNPRNPQFITDVDLLELADDQGKNIEDRSANGDTIFHHDMVVKEIGGVQTMLVSYWDSGYLKLNVEDPANPLIIGDSDFDRFDPLVMDPGTPGLGFERPEGNGHQSEFSHDNRFVLAADEDFAPYRIDFEIMSGQPHAGPYDSSEFGFTTPVASLPDGILNGPTVFGGRGCTSATPPDPAIPGADAEIPPATLQPGEEQIVVLSRGFCRFDEKIDNAQNAGYEGVIIGNSHAGSNFGRFEDAAFCGSGDPRTASGICIGHRAMHLLFDDTPEYTGDDGTDIPVGANGSRMTGSPTFDGWGYTHLYRNAGDDLEAVGHFAIEEGIDSRYASGFGDLSVHEFATDPTEYLAYSAYYAGGMRVLRFGDAGLEQTGKFIDQGGSNFWGVEQFTTPQGDRLFAGSDRDFGLYLFRYTGPGAAQKPVCSDTTVMVAFRGSVDVPLACSDANGNPLRQSRTSDPEGGTVADRPAGGWTYTHTANRLGPAGSFTFKANDGVADSNTATASLVAVARSGGRCFNPFTGSSRRDVIVGSPFGDRIRSGGGRDGVQAKAGADCLSGGAGPDRLSGENGNDRLSGGARGDKLSGGKGRDRLSGNNGNDRLAGDAGNDRIAGGGGKNRLLGGAGNDRIAARNGTVDRIRCGGGRDRVGADRRDRVADDCENVRRR